MMRVHTRFPSPAIFYWLTRPHVRQGSRETRLRWGANDVEILDDQPIELYVRYLGLRIGRATVEDPPPADLEYAAPWVIFAPGRVGVRVRPAGLGLVVGLIAVVFAIPAAALTFLLPPSDDRGETSSTGTADNVEQPTGLQITFDTASCPPLPEARFVINQQVSGTETMQAVVPSTTLYCSYDVVNGPPNSSGAAIWLTSEGVARSVATYTRALQGSADVGAPESASFDGASGAKVLTKGAETESCSLFLPTTSGTLHLQATQSPTDTRDPTAQFGLAPCDDLEDLLSLELVTR